MKMTRIFLLIFGLLVIHESYSQFISTTEYHMYSNNDMISQWLIPFSEDVFVFHVVKGERAQVADEIALYYGYTDIFYKMNSDFLILDSVDFPPFQGYGLRLNGAVRLAINNIAVSGLAYDSLSGDYQMYMAWLNDDLEILNEYIWGNNEVPEGLYPPRQKKAGNLVQLGWYPFNPATGMHQHFYLEYLPSSELLRFVKDSSSVMRFDIVSFGDEGKYAQYSSENLTILNADFSTDTVIAIPEVSNFELRCFGLLNDSTFYAGGNILVDSQDYDLDPAIIPIGADGQIFPVIHAGAVDTVDNFSTLKLIHDGFLLAGTKNNILGETSFLMVSKLDANFEKDYTVDYGDGIRNYSLTDIFPLQEGGYIAAGYVGNYDPDFIYDTRNDLVLVRFDVNGMVVGQPKVIEDHQSLMLAPNPATDMVTILDQAKCWYAAEIIDLEGRVVERHKVENCSFFDVKHLSTGVYLVRLTTESGLIGFVRMVKL